MKKIKLFGLLSLFVIPILGNVSFTTSKYEPNLATSELKDSNKTNLTDPNPDGDGYFRVGENEYDTFEAAINGATDGDTIQVLKDFEAPHERETSEGLALVTIDKSLTINGIGDDEESHEIKGQAITISGATVNFENVIINGDKYYNTAMHGGDNDCLLTLENAATLNLNGHTVIKNFKFNSFCVIRILEGSELYINDQTEITDCAAKFGIIRLNPDAGSCPAVYMNGGKVHHNSTSNMGKDNDNFVEGLFIYVAGGDNYQGGDPAIFHMYGGEICNNTAQCFDMPEICESVGLIFLHSNLIDIKIINGLIHDNTAKLGGAICYGTNDNTPFGNIEIGGSTYIYNNYGSDDEGNPFDSNIYVYRPDSNHKIVVSKDFPLTKTSKVGIFLSDGNLPEPGQTKTVVYDASYNDRTHFIADNEDYTMRYEGDSTHTLGIYRYSETDPHLTEPVFNDDLHYNDQTQQLILEPGFVTKGGTLLYSQDYTGVIEEAHWTTDPTQIVGKESGDYLVAYYVTEGGGCTQSFMFEQIVHIGKRLMQITWPEDNFIYNGQDQSDKLIPYYAKEGQNIPLGTEPLKLEDGTLVDEFKKVTESSANRYVLTAINPKDESLDFPKDHTKFYTMRISEEQYIEEGGFVIETDKDTGKPVVKVESNIGYDAWTTLYANKVKQEDKHYQDLIQILKDNKTIGNNDAVSAIYDVKMTDKQEGTEVNPDGTLNLSFAVPKELGNSRNLSVYQIIDGKPTKLDYTFTDDGYITVSTSKLGTFVIVHNLKSLLWLIITLSVVGAGLIGVSTYIIIKEKQKKTKEGANNE